MDANTRFEENTSLVFLVLHRHFPMQAFDKDLQQTGMLGLWKACLSFDESKGYQFSTYASRCIYNEVLMFFRCQKKINRLPTFNIDDYVNEDRNEDSLYILKDKENNYSYSEIKDSLDRVLSNYSDRDKRIFEMYMNDIDQITIGKEVGLSQPQVSRKIKKFKKDMEVELYETSRR